MYSHFLFLVAKHSEISYYSASYRKDGYKKINPHNISMTVSYKHTQVYQLQIQVLHLFPLTLIF